MTPKERMQKLGVLSQLVRDHDMAQLQKLATLYDHTRKKLAQLPLGAARGDDPALFAAHQAHLLWAAKQKMQLNLVLARQRAALLEQRKKTMRSFGRAEAVAQLQMRDSKTP